MLGIVGDVVQDVVVWTLEAIRPATDTASNIVMRRGGSAANVAAFAGERYPTRFIGCVGDDLAGHSLTQEIKSHGVEVKMQVAGQTGMIVVLIEESGERLMFPSRGACSLLQKIDPSWIEDIEALHLTGYSFAEQPTCDSVIEAARQVKKKAKLLSLDVSSTGMISHYGIPAFRDLLRELQPDFISANADESVYLNLANGDEPGDFAAELPNTIVLARHGKEATRIFKGPKLLAKVPVTEPVQDVKDLTGAGDAFNAGFLTAYIQGQDIVAATQAGHSLARRVLLSPGATID